MSDIKVTYTPPPPNPEPPGRVTIELDVLTAARLSALLQRTTGGFFDELGGSLIAYLPEPWHRLQLRIGTPLPDDPNNTINTIRLDPASGAAFF